MEGFADEAENRLDQDLLLLASGNRTRDLKRRLKKYQKFIADADAANTEFAQKYKERILTAATRKPARGHMRQVLRLMATSSGPLPAIP